MPAEPPLVVFDGDCGFCTTSLHRAQELLTRFPDSRPWQWIDYEGLGLTRDDVTRYVWFVTRDASFRGHAAVAALLRGQPALGWRFLGHLLVTPPFSWAAAAAYAIIARFRHRLPGGTPACAMPRTGS